MPKYVYLFTEGNADMRNLLGGKGANLAEMTNIGLPVPQGFTITTEACTQYYEDGREINAEIQKQINEYITKMEDITGKKISLKQMPRRQGDPKSLIADNKKAKEILKWTPEKTLNESIKTAYLWECKLQEEK